MFACISSHADQRAFSLTQMVSAEPIERQYWLFEPAILRSEPALVIVLHGYSGDAAGIANYSGMNQLADKHGFLVAYPQGSRDSRGNAFFNVGYAFHEGSEIDDVAFIESIIKKVQADYLVNPNQVFVTGMSNGGDMSYLLACRLDHLVRAVASIAGSMMLRMLQDCEPNGSTPILAISGTDDPVTLYEGDLDNVGGWGPYAGQRETIAFWVGRLGLQKVASRTLNNTHQPLFYPDSLITFEQYRSRVSDLELWFYRVDGGGHDWPGARLGAWYAPSRYVALYGMGFGKNQDISASTEIWRFFSHWIERDRLIK